MQKKHQLEQDLYNAIYSVIKSEYHDEVSVEISTPGPDTFYIEMCVPPANINIEIYNKETDLFLDQFERLLNGFDLSFNLEFDLETRTEEITLYYNS